MTTPDPRTLQRALVTVIRAELGAAGWTHKRLAEESGIHERTLNRVMQCERDMSLTQYGQIIAALRLPDTYLFEQAHARARRPSA